MLFNSYVFIFLFLPVTVGAYYFFLKRNPDLAIGWLVAASFFYYGWWNPIYLVLIMFSMLFNYCTGRVICANDGLKKKAYRKTILIIGVSLNLGLLGYFKYANFFVDSLNYVISSSFTLGVILLPLAISFFTFQQITYLVDSYYGVVEERNILHYSLFVTFFPQLIAGPIVHHKEMLPQFNRVRSSICYENIVIGFTIFAAGLFKKVVFADHLAQYADPVFLMASDGAVLTFFEAWGGTLAYTLQLYFDFSGYSDMAIGLGRLFGIKLPVNFHSPYKATSIIDFWRRWHITLSRFLKEYLYVPLGGNRRGTGRQNINIMVTMLLGGLWHGAGWTFVLWGGIHGAYLLINHTWRRVKHSIGFESSDNPLVKCLSMIVTFLSVVFAWVVFRAENMATARKVYEGMLCLNGISLPQKFESFFATWPASMAGEYVTFHGLGSFGSYLGWIMIVLLLAFIWIMPSTLQWTGNYSPALNFKYRRTRIVWNTTPSWAVILGIITVICILNLTEPSVFLYYQF